MCSTAQELHRWFDADRGAARGGHCWSKSWASPSPGAGPAAAPFEVSPPARHRSFFRALSASYGVDNNIFIASVRHNDPLTSLGLMNQALSEITRSISLQSPCDGGRCRLQSNWPGFPRDINAQISEPGQQTWLTTPATACSALVAAKHLNKNSFGCSSHDTFVRHLFAQVSTPVRPK